MRKINILSITVLLLTIFLSCKKDKYSVTFTVKDAASTAIEDAAVAMNGETATTNTGGMVTFEVEDGTYSYTVDATGFVSETGSVTVSGGDISENVEMLAVSGGGNLIEVEGYIRENTTWQAGATYKVTGNVYVEGAILTIPAGTIVKFESNTGIIVGGASGSALIANGTATNGILFTSAAPQPSAGDWNYLNFEEGTSQNTILNYCIVEYGGDYADYAGMIYLENDVKITITNSTIRHSAAFGIKAANNDEFVSFTGNTVSDCAGYAIGMEGNFVHTIGTNNDITGGILIDDGTYSQNDATWNFQTCPYIIDGNLYIEHTSGAQLTIEAGNTIQFTQNSGIYIGYTSDAYGTLIANGTQSSPITFTSTASTKQGGQWNRLYFGEGNTNNSSLTYCNIEAGGGYANYAGMIDVDNTSLSIENCTISKSEYYGITLNETAHFESFVDNNMSECGTYAVFLEGNYAHTIGAGNNITTDLGILIDDGTYSQSSATWLKQTVPYVIDGDLYIESAGNAELIIEPGTEVHFTNGSSIYVGYSSSKYGKLVAQGTASEPIIFTSSAPAAAQNPGQWDGIMFYEGTSSGSILDYCEISYGGGYADSYNNGNINCDNVPAGLPTISNCTIAYSEHFGIYTDNSTPTLSNNTFTGNIDGDQDNN